MRSLTFALFGLVAFSLFLRDDGIETRALFGREHGANARVGVLADGIIARAHFGTQTTEFVARLVQYLANLSGLLFSQVQIAAQLLEEGFSLISRAATAVG